MKPKRIPVEQGETRTHLYEKGDMGHKTSRTEAVFSFQSPEHQTYERGLIWHIVIGLIVALLVVYAAYDRAWTFVLAIGVSVCMYYWFLYRQKPKMLDVKITKTGIEIGEHEYNYNRISCFWVMDKLPFSRTITIRLKRHFMPDITLFLGYQNPEPFRHYLKEKIQEVEKNEGVADTLVKIFRI